MKIYSIGRDVNCNIPINDPTDVISRQHAQLKVESSGKMTITDTSRNGTYVNGMRIQPNTPTAVTRKDNISFAHVARLDWNMVPKTYNPLYLYGGLALLALILIGGAILLFSGKKEPAPAPTPTEVSGVKSDSTNTQGSPAVSSQPTGGGGGGAMPAPVNEEPKDTTTKPQPAPQPAEGGKVTTPPVANPGTGSTKTPANTGRTTTSVKKCATCGKPINKCKYNGKHPKPAKPAPPANKDNGGRGGQAGGF